IKAFYEAGTQGKITKVSYPQIDPKCMATLSELLETPFTVAEVLERLRLTLRQLGFSLTEKRPDQALLTDFDAVYERMQLEVARKEGK
ncbi:protein--protein lipoyl transferase, partial [Streptococcus canis]|nr:protein--protein lipoyl transferase [Streptococcus canis]